MSQQISSIEEALDEFEALLLELKRNTTNYNKKIAANEGTWERGKVYLDEKNKFVERLNRIKNTIQRLKYHDQWLFIENEVKRLQLTDREISAVNVFIPLKSEIDYIHVGFIDLSTF